MGLGPLHCARLRFAHRICPAGGLLHQRGSRLHKADRGEIHDFLRSFPERLLLEGVLRSQTKGRRGGKVKESTMRLALLLCFICTAIAQPAAPVPSGVTSKLLPSGLWRFDRNTGPQHLPAFWERVLAQFSWSQKAGTTLPFNRSVAFLVGVGHYKTLTPSLDFVDSDLTELDRKSTRLNSSHANISY